MADDFERAQARHEQSQRDDPSHDDSSCVCCCVTCNEDGSSR